MGQIANMKQKIIVDLNNNDHDRKSLLLGIINGFEEKETNLDAIKCYLKPSQYNDNFNLEFNKQFDYNMNSTLIAPLIFANEQYVEPELIGIIQLINKENAKDFGFTLNDKQSLFPLTKICAVALK